MVFAGITSWQSIFLLGAAILLATKLFFGFLIYLKTKRIERKALESREQGEEENPQPNSEDPSSTPDPVL